MPWKRADGAGSSNQGDGEIIAFASAMHTGNVWALFVHPDHAGRGHGKALHNIMIAWCRSRGLSRLWLSTAPENSRGTVLHRARLAPKRNDGRRGYPSRTRCVLNGLTHAVRQTLRPSDSWLNCCIRLIAADTGSFRSRFSLPLFKTTRLPTPAPAFPGSLRLGLDYFRHGISGPAVARRCAARQSVGRRRIHLPCRRRVPSCRRPQTITATTCAGNLLAAWLWLPVSIALAGNVALNFSGQTGTLWLGISALLFCAILGSFLLRLAGRAIHSRSEPRSRLK